MPPSSGGGLIVADGVISAIGCKTAVTLLKTIELQTWTAIGLFAAVLTLRTPVKRMLLWEEARPRRGRGSRRRGSSTFRQPHRHAE